MANLLDLPEEVLALILEQFGIYKHSPYLLRAAEVDGEAIVARVKLARLARVCKTLHKVAATILQRNRYLTLDMMPNQPYHVVDRLARLSACKHMQHIICELDAEIVTSFLVCLSNSTSSSTLRSLSLTIKADNPNDCVDLSSLRHFPQLSGLEIYMHEETFNSDIIIKPPSEVSTLRDLQIGTHQIHQMTSLLSLAPSDVLEVLGIYCNVPLGWSGEANVWRRSWGNKIFPTLRNLSILVGEYGALPRETLAGISTYFPSLDTFDANYERGVPHEQYRTLLSDHAVNTSISISVLSIQNLEVILHSIRDEIRLYPRLSSIHIILLHFTKAIEAESFYPALARLWSEAHTAASSCGVHMSPEDLCEAVGNLLD